MGRRTEAEVRSCSEEEEEEEEEGVLIGFGCSHFLEVRGL